MKANAGPETPNEPILHFVGTEVYVRGEEGLFCQIGNFT